LCGLAGFVNQVYVIFKQVEVDMASLDWLDWALFSAVPALGYASLIAERGRIDPREIFRALRHRGRSHALAVRRTLRRNGTSPCGSPGNRKKT
jgi:hypothetical protein